MTEVFNEKVKQIWSLFDVDTTHRWWRELKEFLFTGRDHEVTWMLRNVKAMRSCDRKGNSVLHYVSRVDNQQVASKLIEANCDINHKNHAGVTPIAVAAACNSVKVTKLLLSQGANVESRNFMFEFGLLHFAVLTRSHDVARLLIDLGFDVNARDEDGRTPLQIAIAHYIFARRPRGYPFIKLLIDSGAEVNVKTKENSMIPLHEACSRGNVNLVKLLLKAGADVSMKDANDCTPLILAVKSRSVETAKLLVDAGADVNAVDRFGNTGLHYAAGTLNPELMRLLLRQGARVDVLNREMFTPLFYVIYQGLDGSLFEIPEHMDYDDCFKLYHSGRMLQDEMKCIKLLMKHGTDINFWKSNDFSPPVYPPIYESFICAHSQVIRLLLSYNPVFDYKGFGGLFTIRLPNRSKSLHELLRHTALSLARDKKDSRILRFEEKNLSKDLQRDFARCRNEIELMKNTAIKGTRVTYFNVLANKDIRRLTCNEKVIQAFESNCITKKFPVYCDMLIERYYKAVKSQTLVESAMLGLGKIWKNDESSLLQVFDSILSYLDKKDLQNLSKL